MIAMINQNNQIVYWLEQVVLLLNQVAQDIIFLLLLLINQHYALVWNQYLVVQSQNVSI